MAQRLEPLDPIEKVLGDLGKMRGSLTTDLLRLPAPNPFKRGLGDVDKLLAKLEDDIWTIHGKTLRTLLDRGLELGLPPPGRLPRSYWGA